MSKYDNAVRESELRAGKIFYINDYDKEEVVKTVFTGNVKDGWEIMLRDARLGSDEIYYGVSRAYLFRSNEEAKAALDKTIDNLVKAERAALTSTRELADYAEFHINNESKVVNRAIIESAIDLGVDIKEIISKL